MADAVAQELTTQAIYKTSFEDLPEYAKNIVNRVNTAFYGEDN